MGWFEDIRKKLEGGIASINKNIASWERRTGIDIPFIGANLKEEEERRKAIEEWEKERRVSPEEVKQTIEFAQELASKGGMKGSETSPVAVLPPEKKYYEEKGYEVVGGSNQKGKGKKINKKEWMEVALKAIREGKLSKIKEMANESKTRYAEVKETKDSIEIAIPVIQKGHGVKADTLRAIEKNLEDYRKKGFEIKKEYKNGKLIYRILPPLKTYKTIYEVYPNLIKYTIIDADSGKVIDKKEYKPPSGMYYDVLKVKEWLKRKYGVDLKKNRAEIVEKIRQKFDVENPSTRKIEIEKSFDLPIGIAYKPNFWKKIQMKYGLSDEQLREIQKMASNPISSFTASTATVAKTGFGTGMLYNYVVKRMAGKSHQEAMEEAVYEPVVGTMVESERARPAIFGGKASAAQALSHLGLQAGEAGINAAILSLPEMVTEGGAVGIASEATLRALQALAVDEAIRNPTSENVASAILVTAPELAIRAISPFISRAIRKPVKQLKLKEVKLRVKGENIKTLRTKVGNKYLRIGEVEMHTEEGPTIKALLLAKTSKTKSGKLKLDFMLEIPQQKIYLEGEEVTIPRKRVRIKSLDIITKTINKYNYNSLAGTKVTYEEGLKIRPENIREVEEVEGAGEVIKVIRNKEQLTGEKHVTLKTKTKSGKYEVGKEVSGLRSKNVRTGKVKEQYIEEGFLRGEKGSVSYGRKYEIKGDTRDFLVTKNKYLIFEKEISPQQFQKLIKGKQDLISFFKIEGGKAPTLGRKGVEAGMMKEVGRETPKPSIITKESRELVSPSELLKTKTVKQPSVEMKKVPGLKLSNALESAMFRRAVRSAVERTRLIDVFIKGASGAGASASINTGNIGRILPYIPITFFTRLSRIMEERRKTGMAMVEKLKRREMRIKMKIPKTSPKPPKLSELLNVNQSQLLEVSTPTETSTKSITPTLPKTNTITQQKTPNLETTQSPPFNPFDLSTPNIRANVRLPLVGFIPPTSVRFGGGGAKMKTREKEIRRKFPKVEELLSMPSLNVSERKIPYLSSTILKKIKEERRKMARSKKPQPKFSPLSSHPVLSSLTSISPKSNPPLQKRKEVMLRKKKGRVKRISPTDLLKL